MQHPHHGIYDISTNNDRTEPPTIRGYHKKFGLADWLALCPQTLARRLRMDHRDTTVLKSLTNSCHQAIKLNVMQLFVHEIRDAPAIVFLAKRILEMCSTKSLLVDLHSRAW